MRHKIDFIDDVKNFCVMTIARYLDTASTYVALPEAPLGEETGGGQHVILEQDFQTVVNTAHAKWSEQPPDSAPPFFEYFGSQLRQKQRELETRIAFFSLKGEFPAKTAVEHLRSDAERTESVFKKINLTFSQAVQEAIAFTAMQHCVNPGDTAENSSTSSHIVDTTLSIGVGSTIKDWARVTDGSKMLTIKIALARRYGDDIRIDVDAWAREYRENEQLYKTVIEHFPDAINRNFNYGAIWPGQVNESLFHIEHCVNRLRSEQPSLENLEQLDETQQELVRNAVKKYCHERGL